VCATGGVEEDGATRGGVADLLGGWVSSCLLLGPASDRNVANWAATGTIARRLNSGARKLVKLIVTACAFCCLVQGPPECYRMHVNSLEMQVSTSNPGVAADLFLTPSCGRC
jgi:hypothetical protein